VLKRPAAPPTPPAATRYALDRVRPDHVLLRVLGRALVMWDEVEPSAEWLAAQLPPLLRQRPLGRLLELAARGAGAGGAGTDWQALAHAQMHATAGGFAPGGGGEGGARAAAAAGAARVPGTTARPQRAASPASPLTSEVPPLK
jgi:hypothetical protein